MNISSIFQYFQYFRGPSTARLPVSKSLSLASDTEWAALFIGALVPIAFQVPTNLYCSLFKATLLIPCPPVP